MKIVFMGTPDFARDSLKALVENGYDIELVVTNPDKPKGRGMKMIPSDVKIYASEHGLNILQPLKIKNNNEFIDKLREINPDVICVVAYGKIIPKEILDIPKLGCINVHGSLLPKYRGAAPIQWAVLNGDSETGITTMFMNEGMDTGDILLQEKIRIGPDDTTGEVWNKLSVLGADLLVKTLQELLEGKVKPIPQPDNFTLAPMLKKEMAKIDWKNKTGLEIKNLVRGLNPFMGAYSYINDKKIKFWKVDYIKSDVIAEAGEIVTADAKSGILQIATIDGLLSVDEIQSENSKRMTVAEYLRGNKLKIGDKFN